MTASKTKTDRRNERANEVSEVTEVPLFLLKSVRRVNLWLAVSSFPLKVIASHLMRMRHVRSLVRSSLIFLRRSRSSRLLRNRGVFR